MSRLLSILALASLWGCAHETIVQVPVAVPCPPPPVVSRPHLPIADIKRGDGEAALIKAYAATVEALKGYAEELEALLDGYRVDVNNVRPVDDLLTTQSR